MKKYVLAILMGAMLTMLLAACSSQPASSASSASASSASASASAASASASSASASASSASASASSAAAPSEAELAKLIVDEKAKTITVWGQVNGKYFAEETHHFLVNKDGGNGEKAILRAWAQPADFHAALEKLGAKPGNNLTMDDKGKFVEGDKIKVTLTWDGAKGDVDYADCIKTKDGSKYEADIRFGGNLPASNEKKTGCLLCTFSCPVGICSNAVYPYGGDDVFGNADVLPPDGTFVKVTFALA